MTNPYPKQPKNNLTPFSLSKLIEFYQSLELAEKYERLNTIDGTNSGKTLRKQTIKAMRRLVISNLGKV